MEDCEFIFVDEYGYAVTKRLTVWQEDDWKAETNRARLDNGREIVFFHLHVVQMTPSVLKCMFRAWRDHRQTLPDTVFTVADEDSPALDRLRERFGFIRLSDVPCSDGQTRRFYVHRHK